MKKAFIFLLALSLCLTAQAVIIAGGDGSGNTNAPADDPGWANAGRILSANGAASSVTYLGDKWFITAYHVKYYDNPTGVVLNGSSYLIDSSSWTRITNSTGTNTDLILFKTQTRPPVAPLRIRSSRILSSSAVLMIGDGRKRSTAMTYWNASWAVTNASSGVYSGYVWASGSAMRWGQNTVSSRNSFDDGFGIQNGFQTTFDAGGGSNECQGATYDSGGSVFYKNGSSWELAGIMLTVAPYSGQPASTAVYGNQTYAADISYYRAQITNTLVNFDSDIDGLPDWWETKYTNNATAMSASVDSDGDGFSNLREWEADTDPTNAASFFENTGLFTPADQTFYFNGSTARQYQVFYTTNDLAATNLIWIAAHTNKVWGSGTGSSITVTNLSDTAFYRLWVFLP